MFSFNLPPQDALTYLKSKGLELTFDYEEMMHEQHHKAFTVAKITRLDLLNDVHQSLINAMEEGKPFEQWKRELRPTLQEKGWYGKTEVTDEKTGEVKEINVNPYRLRNIYETNLRVAYNVGRYKQFNDLPDSVYWRYVAILDHKVRPSHAALHGMVRHKSDPFWVKNSPPNAWRCRCKVQAFNREQLAQRGYKVTPPETPLPEEYKGAHPDWAYDVRSGASAELETTYYQKAKNALTAAEGSGLGRVAFATALSDLRANFDAKAYEKFVTAVTADVTSPVNEAVAGYIDADVYGFLSTKGITPAEPHIWLTKKGLTHMLRETKKGTGNALTQAEIMRFPQVLTAMAAKVLFDKVKGNVLYIFESEQEGKKNKIAVEVNYSTAKGKRNVILTSGKVQPEDLTAEKIYEEIK